MRCYQCGAQLTRSNRCRQCGADVTVYKKIISLSNFYYNDGLEQASVRNLTGARVSLKRSVKYNKNNTDARNLLGLIYYETGDVTMAVAQWAISQTLQPDDNPASRYLDDVMGTKASIASENRALQKYNQAVTYIGQGSQDMAVIQLKKVVSLNPRMLPAYQMLALLYMKTKQYGKARRALIAAKNIDTNDTTTLRYIKEWKRNTGKGMNRQERLRTVTPSRDRKVVGEGGRKRVIPVKRFENRGFWTFVNVCTGVLLGAAIIWFLVLPGRLHQQEEEYYRQLRDMYRQQETAQVFVTEAPEETPAPRQTETPDTASPVPAETEGPDTASSVPEEEDAPVPEEE